MSLQYLKGVGPERFRALQRLGVQTLEDMAHLFPRRYEDRSRLTVIEALTEDVKQLVHGRIVQARLIRTRARQEIFRVVLDDGTGRCAAVWFNSAYLEKAFVPGKDVFLYGKTEKSGEYQQFIHPDYEFPDPVTGKRIHTGRIIPVYPSNSELTPRVMRTLQYEMLLGHLKDVRESLPPEMRRRLALAPKPFALKSIHFPASQADLESAYRRLVFEEFFFIQLALAQRKKERLTSGGPKGGSAVPITAKTSELFSGLLPYALTAGQKKAIGEVLADLGRSAPMHRLLQGDVGSGKTTVAACALYAVAQAGHQGAVMVPTEILAQQHYLTLSRLLSPAGITVALLAQGMSAEAKERTLESLASGESAVVVGTHALIQSRVRFRGLRLVVIDEQHKFGVLQRQFLEDKSRTPNLLVMTATPIPRTLALTLYGDLDLSVMSDRPRDRGRIETLWVGEEKRGPVSAFVAEELGRGRQAFFVHPLVEKSGAEGSGELKDAERALEDLSRRFRGFRVGLLHGRMSSVEKERTMKAFASGDIRVLVTTSIVEVGIDIPNATVLVVENAERFGLSQLHQLRGRIGRGEHDSWCFLFSDSDNAASADRLRAFTQVESGFEVAEEDLRLRGPGDFLGERQHGLPELRIGDLVKDVSILESARAEAFRIVEEDPSLRAEFHKPLREILRIRFPAARSPKKVPS